MLAALLVLVAGACTQPLASPKAPALMASPNATTPSSDPHPAPVSSATTEARPAPRAAPPTAAWTDPAAITELTTSCTWRPEEPNPDDPSALSCQVHFEQTCNPIDCDIDYQDHCLPACKATCEGCGETCRTSCSSCAARCTGEGCRKACAEATGACLQGCLKAEDHCATATCVKVLDGCFKTYQSAYEKSNCERLRPAFTTCVETCLARAHKETIADASDFMVARACQDTCVSSVLGSKCGPFFASLRIF